MLGPSDSLAQPSRATCERGQNVGIQRRLLRPARRLSCRLCRSRWDLAAGSSRVGVGLQPGAVMEEGRLCRSHAPSRASSRCPARGSLGASSTPTPSMERGSLPPTAAGAAGVFVLDQGRNEEMMGPLPHLRPHPRALPSPSPAAWERLPGLEHAEFHFSNGAPGARPSSASCCQIFWQTASQL